MNRYAIIPALLFSVLIFKASAQEGKSKTNQKNAIQTGSLYSKNSCNNVTFSATDPLNREVKRDNPEERAKALLNTSSVPADFPKYNESQLDVKTYEAKVSQWFKNNPDKKKARN